MAIIRRIDDKFVKANKLRVSYYAGNGEAYIKNISVWQNDEWVQHEDKLDNSEEEEVEMYFSHIINQNEHNSNSGSGYFISEFGTVTKNEFDNSY